MYSLPSGHRLPRVLHSMHPNFAKLTSSPKFLTGSFHFWGCPFLTPTWAGFSITKEAGTFLLVSSGQAVHIP